MKILGYDITLSNVKSFIEGHSRHLIDKYGGDYLNLPQHLKEQIIYRESIANTECVRNGKCICNCSIPELFYATKQCELKCYPELMNAMEWDEFKKGNQIIKLNPDTIIKYEIQDLSNLKPNTLVESKVTVFNNTTIDLKIDAIYTSCSCIKLKKYVNVIPLNSNIDIEFVIDTTNKKLNSNLILDIQFQNNISIPIIIPININENNIS